MASERGRVSKLSDQKRCGGFVPPAARACVRKLRRRVPVTMISSMDGRAPSNRSCALTATPLTPANAAMQAADALNNVIVQLNLRSSGFIAAVPAVICTLTSIAPVTV
jgi:hypothetical protein